MTDNAQIWTEEDVKALEAQIGQNLANAATLLIVGVESKVYRIAGDRTAVAWVKRVTEGTGFTFSRKSVSGELSARDAMIIELVKSGATLPMIADALNIGVGTAHRVIVANEVQAAGGSKRGAGKSAEVSEPTEEPTEATTRKPSDPIATAMNAIDRVKSVNSDDSDSLVLGWKSIMLHLVAVSGLSAEELAALASE
jgi:hypothetical protein